MQRSLWSKIRRQVLRNRNLIDKVPMLGLPLARLFLSGDRIRHEDLPASPAWENGYASISERNSEPFLKTMDHMERYVGAGPVGPNKYWEYPWVLSTLQLEPGLSVLDAGCGRSPIQFALGHLGCDVVGIDPNEGVDWHGIDRSLARRFDCPIRYRREGMESISFPDQTFDRVCCVSVIEHCRAEPVSDDLAVPMNEADRDLQARMMKEMLRVLKPGGLLVVTVDYAIARSSIEPAANPDVAHLIAATGLEPTGRRQGLPFPGEPNFDDLVLIRQGDVDICNYMDVLQTSIGLTFRKP